MRAANPAEKLWNQHRRPEQAWGCVGAFVRLAAHSALPGGAAAFRWLYFLHPSARGRRPVREHFACEPAFFSGFTFLLAQPGRCSTGECPTFPQHLRAGGCLVRQPRCSSGNNPQRGESRTCCVLSGRFATSPCCREVLPSEGPKAVDKGIPKDEHPKKKSLHPPLPFLPCILRFFYPSVASAFMISSGHLVWLLWK